MKSINEWIEDRKPLSEEDAASTIAKDLDEFSKIHNMILRKCSSLQDIESKKKEILRAKDIYSEMNVLSQLSAGGKGYIKQIGDKWTEFCEDVWKRCTANMHPYYIGIYQVDQLMKTSKWLFPLFGKK